MRNEGDKESMHRLYIHRYMTISDCITEGLYWFIAHLKEALLIMSLK